MDTNRETMAWRSTAVICIFFLTMPVSGFAARSKTQKKSTTTKRSAPRQKTVATKRAPAEKPPLRLNDPEYPLDYRGRALAQELRSLWTRDADRLVSVLGHESMESGSELPLTMLLAIAHAETNGRILTVSEAGAVGLAQATPIAYLSERFSGRLFLTDDYIRGARAYFMKKPLHDADEIASLLLSDASPQARLQARALLDSAFKYRREGVEELAVLATYTGPAFLEQINRDDEENLSLLRELEQILHARAGRDEIRRFRDQARDRYRSQRTVQTISWKRYQKELTEARDRLLRREYQMDPELVMRDHAYESAEFLARELDDRFSPRSMAQFLAIHLQTKLVEAKELGPAERDLDKMTAGLYNGGAHNIKRMLAGLIVNLPETEKYMRKVPNTKRRLDYLVSSGPTAGVAPAKSIVSSSVAAQEGGM